MSPLASIDAAMIPIDEAALDGQVYIVKRGSAYVRARYEANYKPKPTWIYDMPKSRITIGFVPTHYYPDTKQGA